ncbi:hypothetical protein M5K25_010846 [Dendrobium thyrsiflorum]|uniref:Kinesin motor domain-containing protein n=1 Tax=Dendrobium thyrsiflorum TaxID=117978 RepID=A0ABD0V1C5_DENTH
MIACISPANINAEETLNTFEYANRARNIQNKPIVNRNLMSNEIQRMWQQLEYLQTELLCARSGGASTDEIQTLKERISWLATTNEDLGWKLDEHRRRFSLPENFTGDNCKEVDEEAAKWEHKMLQDTVGRELNELNKCPEQKESKMKLFGSFETIALKQHFGKKLMKLGDEKRPVQLERDQLFAEVESLPNGHLH